MRGLSYVAVALVALVAACGDDDGGTAFDAAMIDGPVTVIDAPAMVDADPSAPDAAPEAPDAGTTPDANTTPDAKLSPVTEVDCKLLAVDVDITTTGRSFVLTPNAPIPLNGAARITLGATHDAFSGANRTADGLFAVPLGGTKCFKFTEPGTFPFYCSRHNPMEATLTVSPN